MATIYCFSSTGNSLHVAKEIAASIDAEVISMSQTIASCDDEVIGFVFPAYFWNMPKIVESFIKHIEIKNPNAYVFAVLTYGGMIYGISGQLYKVLKEKGITLTYTNSIKCVENYLINYKVNDKEEVHERAEKKLGTIMEDIKQHKKKRHEQYSFINKIVGAFSPTKDPTFDKNFQVSNACVSCNACERICPVNNIKMSEGKPTFQHHCELCLACVHDCPAQAIDYKDKIKDKKRYRNPSISRKELESFVGKK